MPHDTCSTAPCERPASVYGFCPTHYTEWHRDTGELKPPQAQNEAHPNWRPIGTRTTHKTGYVSIKVGEDHPYQEHKGWVPEHRLVMMEHLGRRLLADENVHHINGVRDDNRIENLELWVVSQPAGQRLRERPHCPSCVCET